MANETLADRKSPENLHGVMTAALVQHTWDDKARFQDFVTGCSQSRLPLDTSYLHLSRRQRTADVPLISYSVNARLTPGRLRLRVES